MTQPLWKTPVLVIADDFTGANDAGSGFARLGARVQVLFNSDRPLRHDTADVWIINSDSRALGINEAADRVSRLVTHHQQRLGWLFKKIDSTLRGNIGAEVSAALTASGKRLALVVPAVPRLGRTTRNGAVYVNEVLLTETEFASDPKTPVLSANVLLQMALSGSQLDLATLHSASLDQVLAEREGVVVVDALQDADIRRLIQAAARLEEAPLLVGASGLSDALAAHLSTRVAKPVLAVVGSMSDSAQRQITRLAQQRDIALIDIEIAQLFAQSPWPSLPQWIADSVTALRAGHHTVIRTCQDADQRHDIDRLCCQHGLTRQQLGEMICQFLGSLTHTVLTQQRPEALYLSGGDVAIAVAQALGADGFQIQGLVAGCVPHGKLLNSEFTLPVMTKAGGFGDENTLAEAIYFIEERLSE